MPGLKGWSKFNAIGVARNGRDDPRMTPKPKAGLAKWAGGKEQTPAFERGSGTGKRNRDKLAKFGDDVGNAQSAAGKAERYAAKAEKHMKQDRKSDAVTACRSLSESRDQKHLDRARQIAGKDSALHERISNHEARTPSRPSDSAGGDWDESKHPRDESGKFS